MKLLLAILTLSLPLLGSAATSSNLAAVTVTNTLAANAKIIMGAPGNTWTWGIYPSNVASAFTSVSIVPNPLVPLTLLNTASNAAATVGTTRQGGTAALTNASGNPNLVTNIVAGGGPLTVTSNNAGTFTVTSSAQPTNRNLTVLANNPDYTNTLAAGDNVTFATNSGIITIASSGSGGISLANGIPRMQGALRTNGSTITLYPISDPAKTRLITEGDSITADVAVPSWYFTLTNFPWWRELAFRTNAAVAGKNIDYATNDWSTNIVFLNPGSAGTNDIYTLWIGANDGQTDPVGYIHGLSNQFWRAQSSNVAAVVAFTITPSTTQLLESTVSNRWAVNQKIKQGWPNITNYYVIDVESMFPDPYDTRFYSDGLHLTAQAHFQIARRVDFVIRNGPHSDASFNAANPWNRSGTNFVLRNSQGLPLAQISPTGVFTADGSGLSNVTASLPGYVATNLVGGWGITVVTNGTAWTVHRTNYLEGVQTNTATLAWDYTTNVQTTIITNSLVANISFWPTNLIEGREKTLAFRANTTDYNVTITNFAITVRWPRDFATNGATSFTVTNGQGVEASGKVVNGELLMAIQRN